VYAGFATTWRAWGKQSGKNETKINNTEPSLRDYTQEGEEK